MLEKPHLPDRKIIECLEREYGLHVSQLAFLPLGADSNTAVYRVEIRDATPYFVKLRGGLFDETSVELPKFLSAQGIAEIIAPLETKTGQLRAALGEFKVILYPFVEGKNGYELPLSERQWFDFGAALRRIHTLGMPLMLSQNLQSESYTQKWREMVKGFVQRIEQVTFEDAIAQELAAFLKSKRVQVLALVARAEELARVLQSRACELVLCHADIHAGNLILTPNGALYLVDWDNPMLAPKERDLMSIGAGLFGEWQTPQSEETLFYRGYGQVQIDADALAYYRYERVIADLAVECDLIFSTGGGADRERELGFFKSNFSPGGTIELAHRADRRIGAAFL